MAKAKIFTLKTQDETSVAIAAAAEIIRSAGIVAFPTETVYGLGADACSSEACEKIFAAKGRPSDNPLIVHLAFREQLSCYSENIPSKALELARVFMPGPLTLVLKSNGKISDLATAGLATVALRVPSNEIAHKLLEASNRPIAAPSANISGKPSPTKESHVIDDMADRADAILLGGDCEVGIESTVLDCTTEPFTILRPGIISLEQINEVAEATLSSALEGAPRSPGMKYAHYKPDAFVIAVDMGFGRAKSFFEDISKSEPDAALAVYDGVLPPGDANAFSLGSYSDSAGAAKALYSIFRECDKLGYNKIYVMCPPPEGIGNAVRNRLIKASGELIADDGGS
ncbi:MAG: L-threonylcarbamoyladenylate synthase [Eubacteriaceae bacterium]|nr:L-threonylcarbamoyladenylate synthase [Eubacteriaceae bacterium]